MVRRYIYWITTTTVVFVAFGAFLANKSVLQTYSVGSVKTKSTSGTVFYSRKARVINDHNVSLIVHLPQTLGRALGAIAAARVVQNMARLSFSIDTQLVLRVHASSRGRSTARQLRSCFPNLSKHAEFQDGSTRELNERARQMYERWKNNSGIGPMLELAVTKGGIHHALQMLKSILTDESPSRGLYPSTDSSTISLPFLQVNQEFHPTHLVDLSNVDDIRALLTLDDGKCCSLIPDSDETVLHVRGHQRRWSWIKQKTLNQLSPGLASGELLGHLPNGSKVAIVSPFHSDRYMYILRSRGLLVRIVSQHDIEDFCFLSRAKKELVADRLSPFSVWAATLNAKVQVIRLYNLKSAGGEVPAPVSWLPPIPGSRIHYVALKADKNVISTIGESKKEDRLELSPITIVVQLSGEMGNNVAKIATGKGLQLWAQRQYGIATDLVLRHQEHSKWIGAMRDTKKCFPKLRGFDFTLGNGRNYNERTAQQDQLLGAKSALLRLTTARVEDIEETLSTLRGILQSETNVTVQGNSSNITLPFLLVDRLAAIDVWADKFYDEYRQIFEFNYKECCKAKPDPDETVFHFRNFAREMPHHFKDLGFEELNPNRTANELFRNLKSGDKVAITSRFFSDPTVQTYVDALTSRGIQVRVIQGQTGVEDFCFLLSARKELVGCAVSTYAIWAGYLGNADKVRLYSLGTPARQPMGPRFRRRFFRHFNWTSSKLQEKVLFEWYPA